MPLKRQILHRASGLKKKSKMNKLNMFIKPYAVIFTLLIIFPLFSFGNGVSVDAGLTPARDKWIFRTQLRLMGRGDDLNLMSAAMDKSVLNTVLAYGLLRNLTIMIRQPLISQTMSMNSMETKMSGIGDMMMMVKYSLYRRNTYSSTFGVATVLGIGIPTGAKEVTMDMWNLKPGVYFSWRGRPWAADLSLAYKWTSVTGETDEGMNPGNELLLDLAISYQFSIGKNARMALAPLVEFSYLNMGKNRLYSEAVPNTGESVFTIAPGIKWTLDSFVVESVVLLPVQQKQGSMVLKRKTGWIFGIRYMF